MFRRMRQALHDIGDNSDEEDPKTETNDDGDGSESNVVEENEGEEQTEEMEEGSGKQGQVGEEEAGDEEQIGEDEDEEQTGGAEDEDRLGGAEDEDQAGEVEGEEQTGEGEGEGEETIQVIQVVQIVENPTTDPPPGISRTMSDPVTQTEQSQVPSHSHLYFTHELICPRSKTKNTLPSRFSTRSLKNGPPNTPSSTQAATMTGSPTLPLSS